MFTVSSSGASYSRVHKSPLSSSTLFDIRRVLLGAILRVRKEHTQTEAYRSSAKEDDHTSPLHHVVPDAFAVAGGGRVVGAVVVGPREPRRRAAAREDGEERVARSEDVAPVLHEAAVVRVAEDEAALLGALAERVVAVELDGGLAGEREEDVPAAEDGDRDADREGEDEGEHDGAARVFGGRPVRARDADEARQRVCRAGRAAVGHGEEGERRDRDAVEARERDPHQEKHEVAVVGVPDDVEHPWAVVVHVEHELLGDVVEVRARRLGPVRVAAEAPLVRAAVDPRAPVRPCAPRAGRSSSAVSAARRTRGRRGGRVAHAVLRAAHRPGGSRRAAVLVVVVMRLR
mmetsp:Transcript_18833/g.75122  ORF Transcript_18833/g.75122 Transcript_18833/m.75122 type:complete len:346 (+) Transcript_18833:1-1038(+)